MFKFFNGNKKVTETLYKQNLELAAKNKTLSLLERLYQISIPALSPEEMAKEVTDIICKNLNLEFAGLLIFDKKADVLTPLAFSKSERLIKVLSNVNILFKDIKIPNASERDFFMPTVLNNLDNATNDLGEPWEGLIDPKKLHEIKKESHIKTMLLFPLIIRQEVLGTLLLALNRDYETLNTFEKESIKSFINIIALLLDKAYLYKNLQDSYEVTKKAYAFEKEAKEEIAKMAEDVKRAYVVEKQAKEELEKLDKVKDQFLAQAQHDLRTPLTSIMGYIDLLLGGSFGRQNKKTLEVIIKLQGLANGMIKRANNFLDLAQFRLGKSGVVLKPGIELFSILDEVKNDLDFRAQSKNIYLKLEKPLEKKLLIKADREKLKATLFNIIDNSVKYTQKGGVTVKIKDENMNEFGSGHKNQNEKSSKVLIEIKDTGIGIAKERLDSLFDTQFERGKEAEKVSASGSGIGLYLSSQIIKLHNGKVWVESEGEGKGSTFYVELPLSDELAPTEK